MSTRNTRTSGTEKSSALICLLGVLVMMIVFAVVGHAIWSQIAPLMDQLTSSAPSWMGGRS